MPNKDLNYWKSLDGLRAFAVAIVLAAHAGSPFPRSGGVGVDIFFVLSGFLITRILARECERYGKINRKSFYIRRLLRLSPALLACLALFVILTLASGKPVRLDVAALVLTYTSNYAQAVWNYDMGSMAHCWSLAIEEQFYLLWPFVILLLQRLLASNLGKCMGLLGVALLLVIYRAAMVGTYSAGRIYFGLDTHMDGLVLGSALAYGLMAIDNRTSQTEKSPSTQVFKALSLILVPISIGGLIVTMHFLTWAHPWMGLIGYFLVALASCVLIADLVASPFSQVRCICEASILVYVGKLSYGLYLYHYPIYRFCESYFTDIPRYQLVSIMVVASIATAVVSYHMLEKPVLRLKAKFGHPVQVA
jgi:peptidoglycan/LPS O-acetylase OafA/YrhL